MRDEATYRQFIEEMGDLIEEHGLPHMAGRVLGALLVCVPPHLTMEELAVDLRTSKGAISMATQLLQRLGMIEKLSLPGERRRHYRLRPGPLEELLSSRGEHFFRHQQAFKTGVILLRDEPDEHKRRLLEFQALMRFLEEEMPIMMQRWHTRREELIRLCLDEAYASRRSE